MWDGKAEYLSLKQEYFAVDHCIATGCNIKQLSDPIGTFREAEGHECLLYDHSMVLFSSEHVSILSRP